MCSWEDPKLCFSTLKYLLICLWQRQDSSVPLYSHGQPCYARILITFCCIYLDYALFGAHIAGFLLITLNTFTEVLKPQFKKKLSKFRWFMAAKTVKEVLSTTWDTVKHPHLGITAPSSNLRTTCTGHSHLQSVPPHNSLSSCQRAI